jgi:hypothetical protein
MQTVYLVRDVKGNPPCYISFIAAEDEVVIPETAFGSEKYSEALLHASILFKIYWEKLGTLSSYIESPFDSQDITCYSVDSFHAKKTADHFVYVTLIDQYQSLLTRVSSSEAFRIIKQEHRLTSDQRFKLAHFLKMRLE